MASPRPSVLPFARLNMSALAEVGGKNASLGEMIGSLATAGVHVPDGFAVTVSAYHAFLDYNGLAPFIRKQLADGRVCDDGSEQAGKAIRSALLAASMPTALEREIARAYEKLCLDAGMENLSVAVRSSATAEDLPDASFAGQQDTFLCVRGAESVIAHCIRCFASLFTDRAILYRAEQGLGDALPEISVGVQRMVRSDLGAAGVAFSIDTETGFPGTVLINGSWGLGETVVQGAVDPDEFMVFKPFLNGGGEPIISKSLGAKQEKMICIETDSDIRLVTVATPKTDRARFCLDDMQACRLARWVAAIESHYGRPMDTEWALDGETGELFIVQARPETVQSRESGGLLKTYEIGRHGDVLARGVAIGSGAVAAPARRMNSYRDAGTFGDGEILVTDMTDPNWLAVMRKAAAIVTDRGGRTSHAAIVSRELGVPAITGTGDGTARIETGRTVTVSCCEGAAGYVYDGDAEIAEKSVSLHDVPRTRTQVMLNLADPSSALRWWRLPSDGVGLARMEFVVSNHIQVHPLALVRYPKLSDPGLSREIAVLTEGYDDKSRFFVEQLARGIAMIAASAWPRPVIVRTSDFKTNEYADLLGGSLFEPHEENPMIGWRGASRYIHEEYAEAFALECQALDRVRRVLGFTNVKVMVPFCRTPEEGAEVMERFASHGLVRNRNGLEIYAMCEIPSNVILVEEFASIFDGFSIGSNDLTQLILGVDRDGERMSHLFDESNPAVRKAIETVIEGAHRRGRKVGLCGQGPSDNPAFAHFLTAAGIDSISVTPDSFVRVKENVRAAERMETEGLSVSAAE